LKDHSELLNTSQCGSIFIYAWFVSYQGRNSLRASVEYADLA